MKKIEAFILKYNFIFGGIFVLVIVVFVSNTFIKNFKKSSIEEKKDWQIEDTLHFSGIIEEYNGAGYKSNPTVFTIDNIVYKVPRFNIDMGLNKGDTIIKRVGEHKYYINRNSFIINKYMRRVDTIEFVK